MDSKTEIAEIADALSGRLTPDMRCALHERMKDIADTLSSELTAPARLTLQTSIDNTIAQIEQYLWRRTTGGL